MLIECPDCKTEVSDAAVACPRCARPIKEPAETATPKVVVVSQSSRPSNSGVAAGILGAILGGILGALASQYFPFMGGDGLGAFAQPWSRYRQNLMPQQAVIGAIVVGLLCMLAARVTSRPAK